MHYSEYPENSIEDFEVYEILGRGGFARVYRAKSLKTDQEVAIKIIDKKMTHHHGMTARVRKEVELHSRLKHPSILELYTFFEDANYVYLVLEMCHCGELHRRIRENGPLSEDQARHYLKQIIDGLKYLHSYNILHRDLTLANLLLTKDMKVKIADFGLATQLEAGVEHFTMCGTPNYISPEVVNRSRQGLEADVWSVGCMLYTMLVGKAPFDTNEIKGTLNRVQIGQFNLPSHISDDARGLIVGLLQTNPDKRLNLQQLSMHSFMQMKKMQSLFQDLSITDSGMGSMNKSHSNLDSKSSLRERNSLQNKSFSANISHRHKSSKIHECNSEILKREIINENSCLNCQIISSEHIIKSSMDSSLFPSSSVNPEKMLSYSESAKPNNRAVNTNYSLTKSSDSNSDNLSIHNLSSSCHLTNSRNSLKCQPLNSQRLRPIRQKTRNVILNILDNETVCMEFLKYPPEYSNSDKALMKINEVMCIEPLGQSILVYNPQKMVPLDIDKPVPLESGNKVSHFLLESLPDKYLRKYELAKKFVDLVRSKTPKIIVYTNLAKCMLMENDPHPDFEIVFNDDNSMKSEPLSRTISKIHFHDESSTNQCFYSDGSSFIVSSDTSTSKFPNSLIKSLKYTNECREYCQKIIHHITNISEINLISSLFPMTIGRKYPSQGDKGQYFHPELVSSENLPPSVLDSLSEQLKSSVRHSSPTINSDNSPMSDRSTTAFIPDIGWATQMANGELKVQFNDGCQLIIMYDSSTIEKIRWFPNGPDQISMKEFNRNDILPDEVHSKIEMLPLFVKKLRSKISMNHANIS